MIKKIKNNDTVPHTWCGQEIQPSEYYQIQDIEKARWENNSQLLIDIGNAIALVNNGTSDITDVNDAITYLKGEIPYKLNRDGVPMFDSSLRLNLSTTETMTYTTPDFTERTCWYQKSVKVTDEVLTDSGNHLSYTSAHPWWIDIHHDRLALDWNKIPNRDGTLSNYDKWEVVVKANDVVVTSGYTVNYRNGTVTFDASQEGKTIKATYWHNDGVTNPSEYLIVPPTNHRLLVEHVEMQFSKNLQWNNHVYFEVWAGADLATYGDFPDYLYDAGYGQGRSVYRSVRDCISWFNNQYPHIPAPTNEFTQDILCFPFKFLVATEMRSDQGTLLRLYLKENTEFIGEIATATIYMEMDNT